MGRKLGITENQLHNLSKFETSEHFSEDERLVLHMASALTRTPSDVSDEFFATLRDRFSERELVELSAAIAWENYRARFNRTFALGSDGFSKISVCPLPER